MSLECFQLWTKNVFFISDETVHVKHYVLVKAISPNLKYLVAAWFNFADQNGLDSTSIYIYIYILFGSRNFQNYKKLQRVLRISFTTACDCLIKYFCMLCKFLI